MRHTFTESLHKDVDLKIIGWEEGILMPKNSNITQTTTLYTKGITHINRKQFSNKKRKNQWVNNIQNDYVPCTTHRQPIHTPDILKKYSTLNQEHFSSINKLRKQMQNLEKVKDRWQEIYIETQAYEAKKNGQKICQSGFLKSYQTGQDAQDPGVDIFRINLRQINSCRQKRNRPVSSLPQNQKKSVTLSEKCKQRSKTIHSRGSNRMFSCKNRNLKLKQKSSQLNIIINQIEGKKMEAILKILRNHS